MRLLLLFSSFHKLNKTLICFFGIQFLFLSMAHSSVGKAIVVRGEVLYKSDSEAPAIKLKKGDPVIQNALVRTQKKSYIKILFNDKSSMSLGPNGEIKISKFKEGEAGIISLLKGQIRTKVIKNALDQQAANTDKEKLLIKTKTAALGVRGTDFQTIYNPENQLTSLITFEGQVAMVSIDDSTNVGNVGEAMKSDNVVIVKKGQFSGVDPNNSRASVPTKLSPAQFNTLQNSTTDPTVEKAAPTASSSQKFKNPIPPGVSTKAFSNTSEVLTATVRLDVGTDRVDQIEAAKASSDFNAPPPEGFVNQETGEFSPPAGGFVDLKTGLYIPPPPGSTFDANTGVYIPPVVLGGFDANTGEYTPPKGFELTSSGEFVVAKDTVKDDGGAGGNDGGPDSGDGGGNGDGGEPLPPPPTLIGQDDFGEGSFDLSQKDDDRGGEDPFGPGSDPEPDDNGQLSDDELDDLQGKIDNDNDKNSDDDPTSRVQVNFNISVQ
jgi:hypothetical protein